MRVLHLADLHLNTETHGRTDPETGQNSRTQDFLNSLRRVMVHRPSWDMVLFSGDLYTTCNPSQTAQDVVLDILKALADKSTCIAVAGNHDQPVAKGKASSLRVLQRIGWVVAEKPDVSDYGFMPVICMPWMHGWTGGQIAEEIQEYRRDLRDGPVILLCHGVAEGAVYSGSERSVTIGRDPIIPMAAFEGITYAAMGHLHGHQAVGNAIYPGSIDRLDFGEEHNTPGFVEVEIDNAGHVAWKHIATPARRFVTIHASDASGNITDAILSEINNQEDLAGAIVRILYKASSGLPDTRRIHRALEEADVFTCASIQPESAVREHIRRSGASAEMSVQQALGEYLKTRPDLAELTTEILAESLRLEQSL